MWNDANTLASVRARYPAPMQSSKPDEPAACCAPPMDPRVARRFDQIAGEWMTAGDVPEMVDVSAGLLDLLRDAPLRRPRVLELGSGTGALSVALLEMGATTVTGVDISASSVDVARRRAADAGFGDSARFELGNAVDAPAEPHDWVILDRVICCSAHADRLVGRAIELAGERIGITLPDSRGWRGIANHVVWNAENAWDLLRGGCRGYVHDLRRIERHLRAAGFTPSATRHVGLWHIGVYDRA
jgi:SAM-dependent methyltransferase